MAVYPIPVGRSSDALLTRRLLTQMQAEQKRLLQVEQQLGTGRRIQLSSEDPSSAGRAVTLQRMLEYKVQLQTNLSAGQSFLGATDTALGSVSNLLSEARGLAIQAADSTTSDMERQAITLQIRSTVQQMFNIGNQTFRGRYLFGGTKSTSQPFEMSGQYVAYQGNDQVYRTYSDVDLLFATNVPGQDLFGAVSSEVTGKDLQPILTADTRLADLRGGAGITEGSIVISDGNSASAISTAGARTVGDLVRAIESHPPAGRELNVTIGVTGLTIQMDAAGGGSLIIRDLQGGTTAAELGIVRLNGRADQPVVGADLNPILRLTTQLANLLGTRSQAVLASSGQNNDIILEARQRGTDWNDYHLQLVDDDLLQAADGVTAGNEYAEFSDTARAAQAALPLSGLNNDLLLTAAATGSQWNNVQIEIDASQDLGDAAQVSFDAATHTLRIEVDDTDQTTLGSLVTAINGSGIFTAGGDPSAGDLYDPAAVVQSSDAGIRGNTGNSGGDANTIYVHVAAGSSNANQVVTALQANSTINDLFDTRIDPLDSSGSALAGSGSVDVSSTATTAGGSGRDWDQQSGVQVTNGGQTYVLDMQAAETVEDLLNVFNGSDAMLLAEINQDGTGINVRSRLSGSDFSIGENGGTTASDLGLRTLDLDTPLAALNYRRGIDAVEGVDFTIHRNDGVELAIDVSSATTVGDVLDLINNHPDNLDPNTAVVARLTATGNGIELVDDNPATGEGLSVSRARESFAAWYLGLVPRGEIDSAPIDPRAQAATASLAFDPPHDTNTAFMLSANEPGTEWNGVDVELRNTLVGDNATATYDPVGRRLIIDMADGQTTTNTVLAAVAAEGTFTAQLDQSFDPTNDGSGTLVAPAGVAATTDGGTAESLRGADANPIETVGVFNTLLRLADAIDQYDPAELARVVDMLDVDYDRLSFGARDRRHA